MSSKEQALLFIGARDWEGLERMLSNMSNMEFRRMERTMREEVLPELDNEAFWETLLHIIIFKRQAFISGAAAVWHLAKNNTLNFETPHVKRLYNHLKETHAEAIVKLCRIMLPEMTTEEQMVNLWKAFNVENETTKLSMLLKTDSPLSYYLIFKILKLIEDKVIARKCCMTLIKRNSDQAFNAVSLIKTYLGLDDLPARFSLKIEEFELSHIDRDFNTFQHVLNGKRPNL
ncbi:MAG: hypothetical protein Q4F47_08030 [Bacteroidaceae bacterium]|nr:hypothetical protein [Bacteroidaceae bacterium]